jgi:hypothetical protein
MSAVYIDFICRNVPDVSRAFRDVGRIISESESRSNRAVSSGARSKEREYAKLAKDAERWQKQAVRSAEKAVADEVRALERSAPVTSSVSSVVIESSFRLGSARGSPRRATSARVLSQVSASRAKTVVLSAVT